MPENRLEIIIGTKDDQFRQGMARVRSEAASSAKSIGDSFSTAGKEAAAGLDKVDDKLDDISDGIKQLNFSEALQQVEGFASGVQEASSAALGSVSETSASLREFQRTIKAAYETAADQRTIIQAGEKIRAIFGEDFEFAGIADGAKAFKKFGADANTAAADLQRAARVARTEGEDIAKVSEILAEAFSKDAFDAGIGERVRGELGIGTEALRKYGAQVDENNQLILEGAPAQEAFQQALRKVIDESSRYADVSKRIGDNVSDLQKEQDRFKNDVSETYGELKELVSGPLADLLRLVNELPDGLKTMAVGLGLLGPQALGVGAQFAQIYTAGKLLTGGLGTIGTAAATAGAEVAGASSVMYAGAAEATAAFTGAETAAAAAGTAAGGLAIGIAGVGAAAVVAAVGVDQYNQGVIDAEKAQQDLLDTQALAAAKYDDLASRQRRSAESLIEEANAIEDAGKRRAQYSLDILAYQDKVDSARQAGDAAAEASAQKQLDLLEKARAASDYQVARDVEAEEDVKAARKAAYDESAKFMEEYRAKRAADAEKTAREEEEARKKAEEAEKAHQDRLVAIYEEAQNLKRSALALDRESLANDDAKIAALEKQLDGGKDVVADLEKEIKGRVENEKKILDAEAALERAAIKQKALADAAADPRAADKIKANAAEATRQIDQKLANDKARLEEQADQKTEAAQAKKQANKEKAAAQEAALEVKRTDLALQGFEQQRAAQQAAFDERRAQLEQEISLGQNRTAELAKLDAEQAAAEKTSIEERAKLQIAAIEKRRDAEKAGKTSAEQELIVQQAQLDIEKAKLDAKLATKAVVDQSLVLQQQQLANDLQILQALKDQNTERDKAKGFDLGSTFATGPQSVADAFGSNASGLGVSRSAREGNVAPDGRTQAEVERDIARQQGILNSQATRTSGADPSSSTFGISRGARTAGGQSSQISDTPGTSPAVDTSAVVAEQQKTNQLLTQLAGGGEKLNNGWEQLLGRSRGGPNLPGLA